MVTYSTLVALAACLCATLEEAGAPTCFCGVLPGEAVALDAGGCKGDRCGQAWVRLGSSYPAKTVGTLDVSVDNCAKPLGHDIEVGVMRCISVDTKGKPRYNEEITQRQVDDMELMRKAILCCDAIEKGDSILSTYSPQGPLGLMLGGVWLLHVATI